MEHVHDPEELLEHAGWLRALARSLVRDSATADDLVQDTLQAALAAPPRRDGLRAWLARVLRNEAAQRRRGDARRLQRERASARGEELPSAGDLAARMELQRRMVEGVLRLDEPYRSTVVLRYYEGLSSAEIARRQSLPAATVRSRLKRGLDELRRGLDEQADGKREAWCAVLLPWIDTPEKTSLVTAGALASGVLTMSTGMKLALAAGGLAAAVLAFETLGSQSEPVAGEVVAIESTEMPAVSEARETPLVESAQSTAERAAVQAHAPPAMEEPAAESAPGEFAISALVVDENHAPLEGARLILIGSGIQTPLSTSDGRLFVNWDAPYSRAALNIEVACDGFVTHRTNATFERRSPVELGQVVLAPGGSLHGLLVDRHGMPVPDAEVRTTIADTGTLGPGTERLGPDPWAARIATTTDTEGRFRFDGLAVGHHLAWARRADTLWAVSAPIEVRARELSSEVRLQLVPAAEEDFLMIRVLTPEEEPAVRCLVRYRFRDELTDLERYASTDEEGRVRLLAMQGGSYRVRIEDRQDRWPDLVVDDVQPGADLLLRFDATPQLTFELVDPAGEPVEGARVMVHDGTTRESARSGTDDSSGLFVAQEPTVSFTIVALGEGYLAKHVGPFAPGELQTTGHPMRIELTPSPGLAGRVSVNGTPVAGALVTLFRLARSEPGAYEGIRFGGFPVFVNPWPEDPVTTDEVGRFHLPTSSSGGVLVRVEHTGYAPAEVRLPDYDATLGRSNVDVHLNRGGAIEGRVIVPAGGSPKGTLVVASRGDARPQTRRVDEDGEYFFENLMPGPWAVEVAGSEVENGGGASFRMLDAPPEWQFSCEVFEGDTTHFDLDLRDVPTCSVTGTLLIDGEPASGWAARLDTSGQNVRSGEVPQALLDASGHFRLETGIEGSHTLSLVVAEPNGRILLFQRELTLSFGTTDVSLSVDTAPVRVENVPRDETHFLMWEDGSGHACRVPLMPDEDGVAEVPRFPLGQLRVTGSPGERRDWANASILAREVLGSAGTTVRLP